MQGGDKSSDRASGYKFNKNNSGQNSTSGLTPSAPARQTFPSPPSIKPINTTNPSTNRPPTPRYRMPSSGQINEIDEFSDEEIVDEVQGGISPPGGKEEA
ncbi:hypothetical protein K3495_g17386 [Podosphaera aphanis]|nr:hypothetical protein K3495_g17386 [Podosphaera aphanis]